MMILGVEPSGKQDEYESYIRGIRGKNRIIEIQEAGYVTAENNTYGKRNDDQRDVQPARQPGDKNHDKKNYGYYQQ